MILVLICLSSVNFNIVIAIVLFIINQDFSQLHGCLGLLAVQLRIIIIIIIISYFKN